MSSSNKILVGVGVGSAVGCALASMVGSAVGSGLFSEVGVSVGSEVTITKMRW